MDHESDNIIWIKLMIVGKTELSLLVFIMWLAQVKLRAVLGQVGSFACEFACSLNLQDRVVLMSGRGPGLGL